MAKYVYFFGGGRADGGKDQKMLLGGKGAGLAEMTNIGIPVPPGFTISTEVCRYYYKNQEYPEGLNDEVETAIEKLEVIMGKEFGSTENPLLVSVRSGAPISMPGMMDTILNLGLNNETIRGLIKEMGDERAPYDAYRRFIQMFGSVVLKIKFKKFEEILQKKKDKNGVRYDTELSADDLKELIREYKNLVHKENREIPEDPREQLWMAVNVVFNSWNNKRAIEYRRLHKISDDLGTGVNVQAMVFGNVGPSSGTGVAFTRNPSTGEHKLYGEYLINAQGEDVVAGIRTPTPISELHYQMPEIYDEFSKIAKKLEEHYRDIQDIEFTIENKKLYILQTRSGKRTPTASVKVAFDMVQEGLITKDEALISVDPEKIKVLLHPQIDPNIKIKEDAKGLPASPGVAVGKIVFTPDDAVEFANKGEKVILVRDETSPDDIHGMAVSSGILTARGGMTSHAAVVARGMGKPCVCGCDAIKPDEEKKELLIGEKRLTENDTITIDGTTGNVYLASVPFITPKISKELELLLSWADEKRSLGVRANADDPESAKKAREFGAEGIGLCRTEHMFFGENRLPIMQEMIMADDEDKRKEALNKLLPFQRDDFIGIFKEMDNLPVTIRLLDPPLHEFLPRKEDLLIELTRLKTEGKNEKRQNEIERILHKLTILSEANPMLGHRGCRLGIVFPEISEMQTRAILEAACILAKEGRKPVPEIMVPLVGIAQEFDNQKKIIDETAKKVFSEQGIRVEYKVGTMIEVPRASLTANKIAENAEFFSFGTNDLTQTAFGFSRDDAERKFIPKYLADRLLKENPFEVLDQEGVGELVRMGVERGRKTRPDLKIGICGEHGGEPSSIKFCHDAGLDYVSCSPYRVPIARLASAQAVIKIKKETAE
ncbi:TPA: pyruvate, phosphate dikinase [bacterium]|nr:pyruvate, phosphate dikinase [bacterium]